MLRLDLTDGSDRVLAALRALAPPAVDVRLTVSEVVASVRARGDAAVREFTQQYDGVELPAHYAVPATRLQSALRELQPEVRAALQMAADNVRAYHEEERDTSWRLTLRQGQQVGQHVVPVAAAGLYVPGGLADYPSSVVMTALPAQVAGVPEIVVCSPPRPDGGVAPGVAAACALLGLQRVYPVGGAQAAAAMALGTEAIPRCDVIVGPGNAFVTEAKRQLIGEVAIDGLAGPSEVLVVAGPGADAEWLAADLLAQAEHGSGAMAALLDVEGQLSDEVAIAVERLADRLRLRHDSVALVSCSDIAAALSFVDLFAPEHLELHVPDAEALLPRVHNAGAVFLGEWAATAFADYVAGTNHVLPTGGAARFGQGLSVRNFQKHVAVMSVDRAAARALASAAAAIADEEGLRAHALSARLRAQPRD